MLAVVNEFIRVGLSKLNVTPSMYSFLFPPEIKAEKIQEMLSIGVFPTIEGLAPAITFCIILSLMRYILHVFIIQPLAEISMQVKEVPLVSIPEIDAEFKNPGKFVDTAAIKQYCAKSGKKVLDVRNYLWTRKKNDVIKKKIVKYVEAAWRCMFYSVFCVMGYYALFVPSTAIWVTDTMHHFIDWPLHPVSDAVSLYYQVELGCYFHQLLWTEVNHSDALQMITHHVITITLLIASYLTNYTRIGASILLIHDLPDVILEFSKVLHYTSKPKSNAWLRPVVDGLFVVFMLVFFVTRLVLYPRQILYSVIVDGYQIYGCEWGGCYVFIGLLCALQCLHIFWFYLIVRMAYRLVVVGQVEGDVRSDDEGDDMVHADGPPPLVEDAQPAAPAAAATAGGASSGASTSTQDSAARRRKN